MGYDAKISDILHGAAKVQKNPFASSRFDN
jgi:hypothetical protein